MSALVELMQVVLYVQDMNALVAFYRDQLGLRLRTPQGLSDYSRVLWVEFETGACTLVLRGGGQRKLDADAPRIIFRSDDIHATREELSARGVSLGELRSPVPGVLVCDGLDPDGNKFSIKQIM